MSNMEVLEGVSAIVSIYHESAELLKDRMAKRLGTGAKPLQESGEEQLLDSLVTSEQQIGFRYTQDMRELGDAVQGSIELARHHLADVAVVLGRYILSDLRMPERSKVVINDFGDQKKLSVLYREDTLKILDDLRQRNMIAKPLQHPFGQRPGSSETFQTLSRYGYRSVDDASKRYIPFAPVSRPDTSTERSIAADHFPKKHNSSAATLPSSRSNIGVQNPPMVNYAAAFEQLVKRRDEGQAITLQVIDETMALHQRLDAGDWAPSASLSYAPALDPRREHVQEQAYDWAQSTSTVTSSQIESTSKKHGKSSALFTRNESHLYQRNPYGGTLSMSDPYGSCTISSNSNGTFMTTINPDTYYGQNVPASGAEFTLGFGNWVEYFNDKVRKTDGGDPGVTVDPLVIYDPLTTPRHSSSAYISKSNLDMSPYINSSNSSFPRWFKAEPSPERVDRRKEHYLGESDKFLVPFLKTHRAGFEEMEATRSAPGYKDFSRAAIQAARETSAQISTPMAHLAEHRMLQNRFAQHFYRERFQKALLESKLKAGGAIDLNHPIEFALFIESNNEPDPGAAIYQRLGEKMTVECRCYRSHDQRFLIRCLSCGKCQHIFHYYESASEVPDDHFCVQCKPRYIQLDVFPYSQSGSASSLDSSDEAQPAQAIRVQSSVKSAVRIKSEKSISKFMSPTGDLEDTHVHDVAPRSHNISSRRKNSRAVKTAAGSANPANEQPPSVLTAQEDLRPSASNIRSAAFVSRKTRYPNAHASLGRKVYESQVKQWWVANGPAADQFMQVKSGLLEQLLSIPMGDYHEILRFQLYMIGRSAEHAVPMIMIFSEESKFRETVNGVAKAYLSKNLPGFRVGHQRRRPFVQSLIKSESNQGSVTPQRRFTTLDWLRPDPSTSVYDSGSAVKRGQSSLEPLIESAIGRVPSKKSKRFDIEQVEKPSGELGTSPAEQQSAPFNDEDSSPFRKPHLKDPLPSHALRDPQHLAALGDAPLALGQCASAPGDILAPEPDEALAIPHEAGQEADLASLSAERHVLTEFSNRLPSHWGAVRDCLPESYKWDVEFIATHCVTEYSRVCWTCTPCLSDHPREIPLTIAAAPVVLPVEHVWPPIGGVSPPPDPRLSRLIDCRAEIDIDVIKDIFLTFEGSLGFYILINGFLQIIVTETFDTTWASSHLPHKFGGLKVSYIQHDLEPTMLPTETTTASRRPASVPHSTRRSDPFRTTQPHQAVAILSLQLNDTIEARGKSLHREKYSGRIGLRVSSNNAQYLVMSSHVITEAILARSFFGMGRQHIERLRDDWNNHIDIWAGNEKIGSVFKTFDTEAGVYPDGFQHDITLIKPINASSIRSIKAPLHGLGWLSQSDWSKLRQQTMPVKILGSDNVRREAKTLKCSLDSEVLVVGEGIFFNQMAAAGTRSAKDHDKSTWTRLVSRAILYRVHPDFDPPNGYSGIALYVERTKEDGTQVSEVAGFQSFVQRSGQVQNFGMEGPALEQRLRTGRVAFYGAFQVPDELRRDFSIL